MGSIDEQLAISSSASAAIEKTQSFVKAVDDTCGISHNSKAVAAKTVQVLNDFNDKHQVSDKFIYHAAATKSAVSSWLRKSVNGAMSSAMSTAAGSQANG